MSIRPQDPEHLTNMVHCAVEGLRARLHNVPGFNYLGRLQVCPERLPANSVEANWLKSDVRTLRELADQLEACHGRLTGSNEFQIAAE